MESTGHNLMLLVRHQILAESVLSFVNDSFLFGILGSL
jgi:hypothetical protein